MTRVNNFLTLSQKFSTLTLSLSLVFLGYTISDSIVAFGAEKTFGAIGKAFEVKINTNANNLATAIDLYLPETTYIPETNTQNTSVSLVGSPTKTSVIDSIISIFDNTYTSITSFFKRQFSF